MSVSNNLMSEELKGLEELAGLEELDECDGDS